MVCSLSRHFRNIPTVPDRTPVHIQVPANMGTDMDHPTDINRN